MKNTLAILACVLVLTGCVQRGQADERLARGCAAAAELFLDEGFRIKEIRNKTFRDDPDLGKGYRQVTLSAVETDSWLDVDKEYRCIFVEEFGFLNSTHTATIYQVKVNGETYGREGDQILGSFEDQLRLTETVEQAMNGL